MSQQKPEPAGEPGSLNAEPAIAKTAEADAPKAEAQGSDTPKPDAPDAEAPHAPGAVMVVAAGDRASHRDGTATEAETVHLSTMFGKRRLAALAAVVALAIMAGALGGALATAGMKQFAGEDAAASANRTVEASIARIDADIAALKADVEHTAKLGTSQFNKASDRLDKIEKAQADPAAKLAKLSEAVDKLRNPPIIVPAIVAAVPVAAKDAFGAVAPTTAATPVTAPKVEVARLPVLEGWALRDVGHGVALIEGPQGMYEVYAGVPVPGLGRVDAIRRQDGRWVVVTSKGLIAAR